MSHNSINTIVSQYEAEIQSYTVPFVASYPVETVLDHNDQPRGSYGRHVQVAGRSKPTVYSKTRTLICVLVAIFLLAQDLIHRPALCELINKLIKIANLLHDWFFNILYPNTTDRTSNKLSSGI